MKSIKIEINNKKVEVKKLPLGKLSELVTKIKNIPSLALVLQAAYGGNESAKGNVLSAIFDCIDDIAAIVELSTDVVAEKVKEEFGIADIYKVFKAVVEVNELDFLKKELWPMIESLSEQKPSKKQ